MGLHMTATKTSYPASAKEEAECNKHGGPRLTFLGDVFLPRPFKVLISDLGDYVPIMISGVCRIWALILRQVVWES